MTTEEVSPTAIAEYNVTAAELAKLKLRLKDVKYDVTTTAGMDSAKKDRRELVTLRTSLEAKRKEIKAPALERCNFIDSEAKRITAELLALETPIDQQIKAEEAKKEEERAEKARIAAAAQKVLDDKILEIGKLPMHCIGKSAEDIGLFLAKLEAREIGGEFTGETRERAEAAKAEAIETIRTAHAETIEREAEAARQKAAREEADRLAAIEREAMAKQQAELDEQKRLNDLEAARLKKIADDEAEKLRLEREAFQKEQDAINAARAEEDRIAREKREAEVAEGKRKVEEAAAKQREEERQAAIVLEQSRVAAEKERKIAEKKAKLLAAKCKDAATAFKNILAICQDKSISPAEGIEQISIIAEGNINE